MWDSVRFIGTPLALAAFLIAAVATVALAYLRRRLHTIQTVKEAERASVITAGDVRSSELDMSNLTREQKVSLVVKSMDHRIERLKLYKGLVTLLVVIVPLTIVALAALWVFSPADLSNASAEKSPAGESKHVALPLAQKTIEGELDELPIPPPENFPSPEVAGVTPLTEDDRQSAGFADTRVMIRNETGERLQVLFSYRPYKKRDPQASASDYVHRSTQFIIPGVTFEHREENFGGPVHVSINTNRTWIPTNEWVDLKVVPRRTLVVREVRSTFSLRVDYEGDSP